MSPTDPKSGASGYVCPECGGALWRHESGESLSFQCRIGDTFSALELWVQHSATRNTALRTAARALAENAALAHEIARWARGRGDEAMAQRLDQEAGLEEDAYAQVQEMLGDLVDDDAPVS
jgi:two-component system chemotaxis response regulator CheB